MNFAREERRGQRQGMPGLTSTDELVRHGMGLQSSAGTVGAIEYLKAHGIHAAVIQRVLTGSPIRGEDIVQSRHQAQTADI